MTPSAVRFMTCLLATSLLSLAGLTGCEQKIASQDPGRVAVLDMARLAQASGYDLRINQTLHQSQQQEQARLMALQTQLGLDKPPAADASPQDKVKFAQARQQMQEAVEEAQRNIQTQQVNELENFRTVARPIAQRVATTQGCSIVMELRDGMLSIDPVSDITDQVIAEMPQLARTAAKPQNQSMPPGIPMGIGRPQQGQSPIPYQQPGSLPQPAQTPANQNLPPAPQAPASQP